MRVSVVATGIHEEVVNQTTIISEPTFKVDNTFYINKNNQNNDLKETNPSFGKWNWLSDKVPIIKILPPFTILTGNYLMFIK